MGVLGSDVLVALDVLTGRLGVCPPVRLSFFVFMVGGGNLANIPTRQVAAVCGILTH